MRSDPSGHERENLLDALTGELHAPLSGVMAVVDLLERQSLPANAAACVRTLRDDAERALKALNTVSDLVAHARGKLVLQEAAFLPRRLLDDLGARWADSAGAPLLTAFDGDPDLAVSGDAARLTQVLDAFIEHGRTAGRGSTEASLSVRRQGGGVRLSAGVRLDLRAPATPSHARPEEGGSALLLARALVKQMGGVIDTRANAGCGWTLSFEIDLPEAAATAADDETSALSDQPKLHVLIVDDNATNRLVAEAFCDMFGCTSDSAEDGVEAVEAASVRVYDLILMDVKMPRMDGVEATRAIRALTSPSRHTPIVALTANADPEDTRLYVAAGMAGLVEKPIKAERLAEVINAVLAAGEVAEGVRSAA